MRRRDITGQKFHRLKAIKPVAKREEGGGTFWECLCDCGKTAVVRIDRLTSGHTKSCGCLNMEKRVARNRARAGSKNPMWKGGRKKLRGYIYIYHPEHPYAINKPGPGGYVAEHRLVMEQKVGRYLKPEERVHHIDGNRGNNIPENLHLFANDSTHFCWHRRLEEIALYD